MVFDYIVTLRRESERTTDTLSLLLCLISIFSFCHTAIQGLSTPGKEPGSSYFLGILGLLLVIGVASYFILRKKKLSMRFRWLLVVAAIGWVGMPYLPWLSVVFLLLAFLETQTKRPLEICFDRKEIMINSLIRRRYQWTDLSNVVLRDGLLTLDFADNRLLQKEVLDDDDSDAEEDEFNDWCKARLEESVARS